MKTILLLVLTLAIVSANVPETVNQCGLTEILTCGIAVNQVIGQCKGTKGSAEWDACLKEALKASQNEGCVKCLDQILGTDSEQQLLEEPQEDKLCGPLAMVKCGKAIKRVIGQCKGHKGSHEWKECMKSALKAAGNAGCIKCLLQFVAIDEEEITPVPEIPEKLTSCGLGDILTCGIAINNVIGNCKGTKGSAEWTSCLQSALQASGNAGCIGCIEQILGDDQEDEAPVALQSCGLTEVLTCGIAINNVIGNCKGTKGSAEWTACLQSALQASGNAGCIGCIEQILGDDQEEVDEAPVALQSCGLSDVLKCTIAINNVIGNCKGTKGSPEWTACLESALQASHNEGCVGCIEQIFGE